MSGFEHSVPVPRSYKLAAKIARQVKEEGANLKSLLYEDKNKHFPVQAVHALVVKTLTHENHLSDLLTKTGLLIAEPRFNPWLARVIITELLFGKKTLVSESKPVQTIRQYHKQFLSLLESLDIKVEEVVEKKVHLKPRYIRINTLRLSAADAVRYFQDQGWNLVRCTAGSYDDFLKQVEKLGQYDFMPDYHVKVVFVFAPETVFFDCDLYHNNEIFLQDKATCLAAFLLAPTPGSTVLDMCAAPGMKTTHLAALIRNEGTIYAVEQDEERYGILCDFIEKSGATCVKPLNKDVITVKKDDCPNVDYVLLDPSCSGSGMRRIEGNDAAFDLDSGRVQKLAAFQAKLLRHALNEYSSAKRVVYSTCSLYSQENEAVIDDVIRNHKGKFRLVSAREKLSKWNNVGDWKHEDIGEKCIYARPESDYTSGFFVAVFERLEETIKENGTDKNCVNNPSVDKPNCHSTNNKSKIVELNHSNNGNMHEEEMESFEEVSQTQNTVTENVINNYNGISDAYMKIDNNCNEENFTDKKSKKKKKSKTELESLEETVVESETLPRKDKKSKRKQVSELTKAINPIEQVVEKSQVVPIKTKKNKRKQKESIISLSNDLTAEILASVEVNTPVKIKNHQKSKESETLPSVQIVDTAEDIPVQIKKYKKTKESKALSSVQIVDITEDIKVKIKKDKIIEKKELETIVVERTETILVDSDNSPVKSKKHKKKQKSLDIETIEVIEKSTKKDKTKANELETTVLSSNSSSVCLVVEETELSKKHRKERKNQSKENVETVTNVNSNIIDIVDSPTKKKKRKHSNNEENLKSNKQNMSKSPTGSDCLIFDDVIISEKKHKKKKSKTSD